MVDYRRAAPFRALALRNWRTPPSLAHRYSLSIPGVATTILGVKNRSEFLVERDHKFVMISMQLEGQ